MANGAVIGTGVLETVRDLVRREEWTDANGLVTVKPKADMNQLLAIVRLPVSGNPKTTNYEYLLAFPAH